MKARLTGALLGVGALGLLVAPGAAFAQDAGVTNCSDLPNPIYLTGSTAFGPVIQAMGAQLKNRTPTSFTLIFWSPPTNAGSCTGIGSIISQSSLTGSATYYPTATSTATCMLDGSAKADVAISDVFFETCGLGARPATIGDFLGPAQAMLVVVPHGSTAPSSITAEEAQNVWGCGMRGMISPWLVETAIQQRNANSGTQNVIARSINVLASSFHGTMNSGSGNMIASVTQMPFGSASPGVTIADPNTAIGFLSADFYDASRSTLTALAFRAFEQTQAFYADSMPSTFDKRNVRDGHYLPWGYEHLIARVDPTSGTPGTAAQTFIDWVQGNATAATVAPNFDPIQLETAAHVIPLCAMKVKRSADGGFLSPYTPADPCNCFFEATVSSSTPAGCTACTDSTTCTGGTQCHHGYCE